MEDLLPYLALAKKDAGNWTIARFQAFLLEVSSAIHGSIMDWDDFAGEEWGRVVLTNSAVAIVRFDIPFAVLIGSHSNTLRPICQEYGVVSIDAQNWDEDQFRIDVDAAEELFPKWRWGSLRHYLDPTRMSAGDFWYATV